MSAAATRSSGRLGAADRHLHHVFEPSVRVSAIERLERQQVGDIVARVERGVERIALDDALDRSFLEREPGGHELHDVLAREERHLRLIGDLAHPLLQLPARRGGIGGRPVVHGDRRALGLHPGALDLVGHRQDDGDQVGGNRPGR